MIVYTKNVNIILDKSRYYITYPRDSTYAKLDHLPFLLFWKTLQNHPRLHLLHLHHQTVLSFLFCTKIFKKQLCQILKALRLKFDVIEEQNKKIKTYRKHVLLESCNMKEKLVYLLQHPALSCKSLSAFTKSYFVFYFAATKSLIS